MFACDMPPACPGRLIDSYVLVVKSGSASTRSLPERACLLIYDVCSIFAQLKTVHFW